MDDAAHAPGPLDALGAVVPLSVGQEFDCFRISRQQCMSGQLIAIIQSGLASPIGCATSSAAGHLQIVSSKCGQFGKQIRKRFAVLLLSDSYSW